MDNIPRNEEWHSLSYSNVLENLNTSSEGLNVTEAGKRLKKEGPNILYRQRKESAFKGRLCLFSMYESLVSFISIKSRGMGSFCHSSFLHSDRYQR